MGNHLKTVMSYIVIKRSTVDGFDDTLWHIDS